MKRRYLFAVLLMAGLVYFAAATGWLSGTRTWQQTSGFNRIGPQAELALRVPPGENRPQFTWLGHSGFLMRWHGVNLLIDPNLSSSCFPVKRLFPSQTPSWPVQVDAALISHAHYDHLDLPTLKSVPSLMRVIGSRGLDSYLPDSLKKPDMFQAMEPDQVIELGPLTIRATTAIHGGNRNHPFDSATRALGYLISDGNYMVFYSGDTAFGPHFARIGALYRPDLAILPIGAYEPHFILKGYHLNPADAVKAAEALGVGLVIPCHFGTFRLAFDRAQSALPEFARLARAHGLKWFLPPLPTIQHNKKEGAPS